MFHALYCLNSEFTSSSFMQSSNYLTNNQRVTVNIKIRSLEGETAFLFLALTSLVCSALFSVIMWQAIFNICLNISCIFLWSRKQFRAACLHIAFPSPLRSRGAAFPFPCNLGISWRRRERRAVRAAPAQAAQGTATCLQHMVMQATTTRSLTWESMWRAALSTSLHDGLAGHSHAVTWESGGQEIPSSSRGWR